jgi:uncharacterized protein with von Willebrand factor type A (vWA) domain
MSNKNYFPNIEIDDLVRQYSVAKKENINKRLLSEVGEWKNSIKRWLDKKNPFQKEQSKFKVASRSLEQKNASIADIEGDFSNFQRLSKKAKSTVNEKFWISEIANFKSKPKLDLLVDKFSSDNKTTNKSSNKEDRLIFRTLLQEQWLKSLNLNHSKWELKAIEEYRRKFIKKISEWLNLVQQLDDALSDLSLESGLFLDLSQGNLSLSDIEQLKKWATYISKDEGVKNLCDMMGRLRQAGKTKRQELIKNTVNVQEFSPDVNSKGEVVGIRLGRDIEHALPQELALLADDEISILFDMKYIEGRLICFDMEGSQLKETSIEEEVLVEVEDKEEHGPIIICVDTSGSMQGAPETIAKAITLFMATRASEQKRNCFLINFSTRIETLDLSGSIGLPKVIKFLQRSFCGGTDASPALNYALKLMKKEEYKKSDLLLVSDFIMASLPESLQNNIMLAKENENKFYSLSIGNMFLEKRMKSIFNNEWVYNPSNYSVHSLQAMVSEI